ncbi:MAG: HigA family addiction module antidote protein [Roseibium sp.]|nr:HigA family addiction module antidote protein [Roseibium sp.]
MAVVAFHPGEILQELYLEPLNMSAGRLARILGLDRQRIQRLVAQETRMTASTALLLAKAFSTTPQYWMNLQANFDLQQAGNEPATRAHLEAIQPIQEEEPMVAVG